MRSEALDGFLWLFTTEMQFFRYPMLSPCLTVLRLVQSSSSKVKNQEYDVFRAKYIGVMVDLKHAEISPPSWQSRKLLHEFTSFSPTIPAVNNRTLDLCQLRYHLTSATVRPQWVEKGDEISNFYFGGSDIVLVFEGKARIEFATEIDTHYRVGETLAVSRAG